VIGMVLAAGAGRRLGEDTRDLPKTLLEVDKKRTILDIALANLRSAGLEKAVVVTGFAADRIEERREKLAKKHDIEVELCFNPKAEEWNNAYSLWMARDYFAEGVLLVNGDTVHPASVEESLIEARAAGEIVIAIDTVKQLGEEEMKVHLSDEGLLDKINKSLYAPTAQGEYIGLTLINGGASEKLAEALEATWRRDPQLYYEDGFQEFADRGGRVGTAPIGTVEWVEVDDHADLQRAREVACRC
jgi:choline kinase